MDWEATMSKQPAFPANTDAFSHNVSPPKQTSSQRLSENVRIRRLENIGFAKFWRRLISDVLKRSVTQRL